MEENIPIGIRLLRCCLPRFDPATRLFRYRVFILLSTFLAYMCYHMTRRPIAVVKPVLNFHGNCSGRPPVINQTVTEDDTTWCDWEPFTGDNNYFGYMDSLYLFTYALCMFVSGFVAERMNLRYFLSLGMLLAGLTTYAFGVGYYLNIHSLWYFFIVQMVAGGAQSTGWPSVVTLMTKWYGNEKKGLLFGVWNAHTSVGNILGANIAGYFVDWEWGLSFAVPGAIIGFVGFIVFLFVPSHPGEVGIVDEPEPAPGGSTPIAASLDTVPGTRTVAKTLTESSPLNTSSGEGKAAISFWRALAIPGVVEFSLGLFFAKLVSYTFLFWLPLYLESTTGFSAAKSATISTSFDYGGILGGILAGWLSDRYGSSGLTSIGFLGSAIPMLMAYKIYGSTNLTLNIVLLFCTGFLVNGPYALITTAVSADLGTHPTISQNNNALATVTAIIDGTGSLGAALGPLFADLLKNVGENWIGVFLMVMVADLCAVLCLLRVCIKEIKQLLGDRESQQLISGEE